MKPIPKAKPWELQLAELRHRHATTEDELVRAQIQRRIIGLEKAVAIRTSLSAAKTPNGKMEFSL